MAISFVTTFYSLYMQAGAGQQMCEPLGENYIGVEPPEGAFFPWRYAIDEPAPEDDLIPEADSHSGITEFNRMLAFLDGDISEVESRYKEWIETNVTSSLLENTQMRALLTEYMCCFVKSEWKGMNIPPLKLDHWR